VLVAQDGRRAVGYALVHMRGAEETWATGERIAELETLTVLPGSRGLGRALVNEAYGSYEALASSICLSP
jgi:ribosomal protein S18 acetylase RimI-like enzyme